jgi:hypothetical protein
VATVPAGSASGSLKGHRRMLSTRVKSLIGGLRRPRESDHDDAEPLAAFDEDDNEAANGSCASAFGAPLRPHRSPDAASFHATKSSSHPLDLDSPASITSFASQTTQASHGSHASPPSSPVVSLSPTRSSSPPPRTASYMSTDSPARVRVRPHARCGHRDSDDDNDNDNAEDSNETPKRTQVTPRRPRTLPPPIAVRHPVQVTAQTPPARRPPREERTNMMTSLGLTPPTARSARLRTKLRVDTSRRPLALLEPLWSGKALRGKSPRAPLVLESHFSDTSDSDDDANTATTPSPSPMSPLVALQLTPTSPFRRPWSMFAPRRTKMETTVVA